MKQHHRIVAVLLSLFASSAFPTTVVTPLLVASDTAQHVQEPSVVARNNPYNTEIITSAFMNFESGLPQIYTITKVGTGAPTQTAIPNTMDSMGDPVLAVNPYYCCDAYGPRTYLAAIQWSYAGGKLSVWHREDAAGGGETAWQEQHICPQGYTCSSANDWTIGTSQYFDKPSIAVSWNYGTRGYVYVSSITKDSPSWKIRVFRSTNGGGAYSETAALNLCTNCQSPTVVVDNQFGNVFLFWIDPVNNKIHVASASSLAASFTEWTSLNTGNLLNPTKGNNLVCQDGGQSIQADSMIAVRYNPVAGNFGVVWHERTSYGTDIKFATYSPDPYGNPNTSGTWSGSTTVNMTLTGDQWHPALAVDTSGNYLVSYYDHRNDTGQAKYRLYATKLSSSGGYIDAADTQVTAGNTASANALRTDGSAHTMGEYHESWFWNGHWTIAHIFTHYDSIRGMENDEVCFSTVTP